MNAQHRTRWTMLQIGASVAIFICEPLRFGVVSFVAGMHFLGSLLESMILDLMTSYPIPVGMGLVGILALVVRFGWKRYHMKKDTTDQ